MRTKYIEQLTDDGLMLVTDSQDTQAVKESLGAVADDYDSFLVRIKGGDYVEVWGFYGSVPFVDKLADRIKP